MKVLLLREFMLEFEIRSDMRDPLVSVLLECQWEECALKSPQTRVEGRVSILLNRILVSWFRLFWFMFESLGGMYTLVICKNRLEFR